MSFWTFADEQHASWIAILIRKYLNSKNNEIKNNALACVFFLICIYIKFIST